MSSMQLQDWTVEYFLNNELICNDVLENRNCLDGILSLNDVVSHELRDGQLVRFRGMIQDMYNPEYYFKKYEVKNTLTGETVVRNGMYIESANCSVNEIINVKSTENENAERHTCVMISTPGLNDWAREKSTLPSDATPEYNSSPEHTPNKAQPCSCLVCPACLNWTPEYNSSTGNGIKRNLDEMQDEEMDCSEPVRKKEKPNCGDTDVDSNKGTVNQNILSKDHIMNFPIEIKNGKACIVKIYSEAPAVKLNQVFDVVGFISLDPALSAVSHSEEEANDLEMQTHNPPASWVSRLHAVKVFPVSYAMHICSVSPTISKAEYIRRDFHKVLYQFLFGDELAADYLICHMISSVYLRKDYLCLGAFPLNISHFPCEKHEAFPKKLYGMLSRLLPKSHYLKLTLENLNDLSFVPKKDYDCNRLTSGILQLSDHTHLVLDETKLTSGQVSAAGRENYNAISSLVQYQKVTYDFKFYTMDYETDIPVLILSDVKSFIPCAMQVPLKIDPRVEQIYNEFIFEPVKQYFKKGSHLNNIRHYLAHCRDSEFEMDDDIAKTIQEDFVNMRQANKDVSAESLHHLMVLARLIALSHGSNTLSQDHWKKACRMEEERLSRLSRQKK